MCVSSEALAGLEHREIGALVLLLQSAEAAGGALAGDDAALAEAAGFGRMIQAWRRIKPRVLRHWLRRADGSIYFREPEAGTALLPAQAGPDRPALDQEAARREKWARQKRAQRARLRGADMSALSTLEAAPESTAMSALSAADTRRAGMEDGGLPRAGGGLSTLSTAKGADRVDRPVDMSRAEEGFDSSPLHQPSNQESLPSIPDPSSRGDPALRLAELFLMLRAARWPEAPKLSLRAAAAELTGWLGLAGATPALLEDEIQRAIRHLREPARSIAAVKKGFRERLALENERRARNERQAREPRLPLLRLPQAGARGIEAGAGRAEPALLDWQKALRRQVGAAAWVSWFERATRRQVGLIAVLIVETRFQADWIKRNYLDSVRAVLGAGARVVAREAEPGLGLKPEEGVA